jgi:hypothetical protein
MRLPHLLGTRSKMSCTSFASPGMPPLACVINSARKHSIVDCAAVRFLGFFDIFVSRSHTSTLASHRP